MSTADRKAITDEVQAVVDAIENDHSMAGVPAAVRLITRAFSDLNRMADALEKIARFETEPEAEA